MRLGNLDGRAIIAAEGRYVDVDTATGGEVGADPMLALRELDRLRQVPIPADAAVLDEERLGPPVPRSSKILAAALNYRTHAIEAGLDVPDFPALFARLPSAISGPRADIELPVGRDQVDWEAELVVVIGRRVRHLPAAEALSAVAGFTCGQDISDRRAQFEGPSQFTMAKSRDTYAPIGPFLVTLDELEDPEDLAIRCRIDGELMQDGRTSDLVFGIGELIAVASSVCTLEPGDLLFTGTPAGVGFGMTPPRYLDSGCLLETEIDGLGKIVNRCVQAPAPQGLSS
jgi:2-keto-4-pentenoate hydratase/2-oxohepta-3-ene-1,7-dioic acid hydratase in catechol pathway